MPPFSTWPPKCRQCGRQITDWPAAGVYQGRWTHKACWVERWREAGGRGPEPPALCSPAEGSAALEAPLIVFLLMFHFGIAAAVAGWVLLTRDSTLAGAITLSVGVAVPLIGGIGAFLNFRDRHRFELIRQELELSGGWTPIARP